MGIADQGRRDTTTLYTTIGTVALLLGACGVDSTAGGGTWSPVDAAASGSDAAPRDAGTTDPGSADSGPVADGSAAEDTGPEAAACAKGDRRCSAKNAYAYEVCDHAGQWEVKICESNEQVCVGGECKKAACAPEQKYCEGSRIMNCAKDGMSGAIDKDCAADGKICMAGECKALVCAPGTSTCIEGKAAECNADGGNWSYTECIGGTVCDAGTCQSTVCYAGEIYCKDGKAIACNTKRTAFEVVKDCKALGQTCDKGECGAKICTPDATKCDGDKVRKCSPGGTTWLPGPDCAAKGQQCVGGGCAKQVCQAGQTSCIGADLATCAADGLTWKQSLCPAGEVCSKGACFKPMCSLPKSWSANTQTFDYWGIATSTSPWEACDLNGDGKADNAFGGGITAFAKQINDALQLQLQDGNGVLLLEAPNYVTDGTKFPIGVFIGNVDKTKGACSPTNKAQACEFKVGQENYDLAAQVKGDCPPAITLPDATISGGKLLAYGPKNKPFTISLPIALGKPLALNFHKMRVEGKTTSALKWTTTTGAKLCGAIKKKELIDTLNALPDSFFNQAGVPKSVVVTLLGALIKEDIDLDGDGKPDASSAALVFSTHSAKITGY